MTSVQLRQIEHRFSGTSVLSGLDLTIQSGTYVVILGQNGCGKTTTLRIIAGLVRPHRGSVFLDDHCVDRLAPRQRRLSMVFQSQSLYPHLTIGKNLAFGNRSSDGAKLAAETFGLTDLLDRYPHQLSGGQTRRAAIAKSAAAGKPLRLLDEPLSWLDTETANRLQLALRRIHVRCGGTTIHVTHQADEAMRMADKVAVIHQGRLVQYDDPASIQRLPVTLQVAKVVSTCPLSVFGATWTGQELNFHDHRIVALGDWAGHLRRFSNLPRRLHLAVPANKVRAVNHQDDVVISSDRISPRSAATLVVRPDEVACATVGSDLVWSSLLGDDAFHAVDSNATGQERLDRSPQASPQFSASADDIWFFDASDGTLMRPVESAF